MSCLFIKKASFSLALLLGSTLQGCKKNEKHESPVCVLEVGPSDIPVEIEDWDASSFGAFKFSATWARKSLEEFSDEGSKENGKTTKTKENEGAKIKPYFLSEVICFDSIPLSDELQNYAWQGDTCSPSKEDRFLPDNIVGDDMRVWLLKLCKKFNWEAHSSAHLLSLSDVLDSIPEEDLSLGISPQRLIPESGSKQHCDLVCQDQGKLEGDRCSIGNLMKQNVQGGLIADLPQVCMLSPRIQCSQERCSLSEAERLKEVSPASFVESSQLCEWFAVTPVSRTRRIRAKDEGTPGEQKYSYSKSGDLERPLDRVALEITSQGLIRETKAKDFGGGLVEKNPLTDLERAVLKLKNLSVELHTKLEADKENKRVHSKSGEYFHVASLGCLFSLGHHPLNLSTYKKASVCGFYLEDREFSETGRDQVEVGVEEVKVSDIRKLDTRRLLGVIDLRCNKMKIREISSEDSFECFVHLNVLKDSFSRISTELEKLALKLEEAVSRSSVASRHSKNDGDLSNSRETIRRRMLKAPQEKAGRTKTYRLVADIQQAFLRIETTVLRVWESAVPALILKMKNGKELYFAMLKAWDKNFSKVLELQATHSDTIKGHEKEYSSAMNAIKDDVARLNTPHDQWKSLHMLARTNRLKEVDSIFTRSLRSSVFRLKTVIRVRQKGKSQEEFLNEVKADIMEATKIDDQEAFKAGLLSHILGNKEWLYFDIECPIKAEHFNGIWTFSTSGEKKAKSEKLVADLRSLLLSAAMEKIKQRALLSSSFEHQDGLGRVEGLEGEDVQERFADGLLPGYDFFKLLAMEDVEDVVSIIARNDIFLKFYDKSPDISPDQKVDSLGNKLIEVLVEEGGGESHLLRSLNAFFREETLLQQVEIQLPLQERELLPKQGRKPFYEIVAKSFLLGLSRIQAHIQKSTVASQISKQQSFETVKERGSLFDLVGWSEQEVALLLEEELLQMPVKEVEEIMGKVSTMPSEELSRVRASLLKKVEMHLSEFFYESLYAKCSKQALSLKLLNKFSNYALQLESAARAPLEKNVIDDQTRELLRAIADFKHNLQHELDKVEEETQEIIDNPLPMGVEIRIARLDCENGSSLPKQIVWTPSGRAIGPGSSPSFPSAFEVDPISPSVQNCFERVIPTVRHLKTDRRDLKATPLPQSSNQCGVFDSYLFTDVSLYSPSGLCDVLRACLRGEMKFTYKKVVNGEVSQRKKRKLK